MVVIHAPKDRGTRYHHYLVDESSHPNVLSGYKNITHSRGTIMIEDRYTIFTKIPLFIDDAGQVFTDDLWHLDLTEHLLYITNFNICCPILPFQTETSHLKPVIGLRSEQIFPIAEDKGWGSVARNLLPNFVRVYRAARPGGIMHSGGAGWAFPPSYYLLFLRFFMTFKWIMVIESSFWMKPSTGSATMRQRVSHSLNGFLMKKCVQHADARIFTQNWYRQYFLGSDRSATLLNPAVWINSEDILDPNLHAADWNSRKGPTKLLFPARLVADKGVDDLLEAISLLDSKLSGGRETVSIDIIGSGDLEQRCRDFAKNHKGAADVRFLDPVPYGAPFFNLLRQYDAVLIPNRQDEQPRILFDAFSQGVPCIASNTSGIVETLVDGKNGRLFPVRNKAALADRIAEMAGQRSALYLLGVDALDTVKGQTHRAMHRTREAFLAEQLDLINSPQTL